MNRPQTESIARILVVDDEAFVREAIELYFVTMGFEVVTASGGAAALELLTHETIDLAILDILMPGMDGLELLRQLKEHHPQVEVVMASGCSTLETAVEAMRLGAYDYITKPILNFDEDLLRVVNKALERRELVATNRGLSHDLDEINRELKSTNSELKRRMAELETLYETGRMLGDIAGPEALLDLIEATLVHHPGLAEAVLIFGEGSRASVLRAPGLELGTLPRPLDPTPTFLSPGSPPGDPIPFDATTDPTLAPLLEGTPVGDRASRGMLFPLSAMGRRVGALITFPPPGDSGENIQGIRLLAGLIAAPLALGLQQVTT